MNQSHDAQRFTVAEAANHPDIGFMTLADIATDEPMFTAAVEKFAWLLELNHDSDPALLSAVETDIREDGELFVMLNSPARRFHDWFKRDDWSIYETSEVLRDDVNWPLGVLDRVKVLIESECLPLAS